MFLNDARLTLSGLSRNEQMTLSESRYVTGSGDPFRVRQLAKGRTAFVILAPVAVRLAILLTADNLVTSAVPY